GRSRHLGHTGLELFTEILDRAAQRLHGTRRVSTEGLARAEEVDQAEQGGDVLAGAFAALQGTQNLHAPGQAVAAWRAPAAGLSGEELFHVAQQRDHADRVVHRSEEHTSELQSRENLVCRLLLEKKKTKTQSLNCS